MPRGGREDQVQVRRLEYRPQVAALDDGLAEPRQDLLDLRPGRLAGGHVRAEGILHALGRILGRDPFPVPVEWVEVSFLLLLEGLPVLLIAVGRLVLLGSLHPQDDEGLRRVPETQYVVEDVLRHRILPALAAAVRIVRTVAVRDAQEVLCDGLGQTPRRHPDVVGLLQYRGPHPSPPYSFVPLEERRGHDVTVVGDRIGAITAVFADDDIFDLPPGLPEPLHQLLRTRNADPRVVTEHVQKGTDDLPVPLPQCRRRRVER